MPKFTFRVLLPLALLLAVATSARAQQISPYFAFGGERDSLGTTSNATFACTTGQLFDGFTGACEPGPTMGGLFGSVGVDLMVKRHLGINGEYTFRFSQATYLPNEGLNMRPSFYDVNALWQPVGRRFVPFLEAGAGGARLGLEFTSANCVTGSCGTYTPPSGYNYFQIHFAAGMKVYVKGRIFVKPDFDLHYVRHLKNEFGRNSVFGYTVAVGYTFGKR